jgi:hypothetical protein
VAPVVTATFLVSLALTDGGLAGFRAAAGRSALIRKGRYNLRAAVRGLGCSVILLGGLGTGLGLYLETSRQPTAAFAALAAAGTRMSLVYLPYAIVVLASLAGYFTFPVRASSWTILAGLGPLTIIRPVVAVAGGAVAIWPSTGLAIPIAAGAAVAGVLAIEPLVHRRWYAEPEQWRPAGRRAADLAAVVSPWRRSKDRPACHWRCAPGRCRTSNCRRPYLNR